MSSLFALRPSGSSPPAAPSARVVDGKLILSFPDAVKPILWQMDLVPARASALEVESLQGGQAALVLKTPKGEQTVIAIFKTQDSALAALMTVSAALERAQGRIRGTQPASAGMPEQPAWTAASEGAGAGGGALSSRQSAMRWVAGLAGVVLLAVLLNMLWTLSPRAPASVPSAQQSAPGTPQASLSGEPAPDAVGVPLSADAVLGRP